MTRLPTTQFFKKKKKKEEILRRRHSPCSAELISRGTVFFSHNKTATAGL
jgi:hypothetical protein